MDKSSKLTHFRKFRFNRIQRQYDNVWLWKDINIGPHGRYIFNIDVPKRPAFWMISAFSMSPSVGFGMLPKAIEVSQFHSKNLIQKLMFVYKILFSL